MKTKPILFASLAIVFISLYSFVSASAPRQGTIPPNSVYLPVIGNTGPSAAATATITSVPSNTPIATLTATQAVTPASTPTAIPTTTSSPTRTATATPTSTATSTLAATPTLTPTATRTPTATATTVQYICDHDAYNCTDFSTQGQAQTVFDYCVAQGRGDIHKLDADNDGIACESLPNAFKNFQLTQ